MERFSSPLFWGFSEGDWQEAQNALPPRPRKFSKGAVVFRRGSQVASLGLVASGAVHIESVDPWGNRSLLSRVGPGQVFAETYALTGRPLLVDAVAAQDSQVLLLPLKSLLPPPGGGRPWQEKVEKNLLRLFAEKNLALSNRIFFTAPKTLRGRVAAYLSAQRLEQGADTFQIPFNRQQLADYLGVDRSALSKELGRMRTQGLLDFHKNRFTLHSLSQEE